MIIAKGYTESGTPFTISLEGARLVYRDNGGNNYQYNSDYYTADDTSAFFTIKGELIAAEYRLT